MRESLTCCTKQIAGLVNDMMFKVGAGGGMANLGGLHCFELVLSVRMLPCWLCAKFVWLSELLVLPKTLPILWECCVEFVVLWIFGFKLVGFIGNDIRS